jgi:nucleoside 2-deoxyribosyltransferase
MKIVICGSMSASNQIVEIEKILKEKGHEVVVPERVNKYASGELRAESDYEATEHKIEKDLIRGYYSSIMSADAVIVANYDKGDIKNYIGGNSFLEAGFAHVLNKKLYFVNDIPEMPYSAELRAFQPVILNGDFSRI